MSSSKKGYAKTGIKLGILLLLLFMAAVVARPLFIVLFVLLVFAYFYGFLNWLIAEEGISKPIEAPAITEIRQSLRQCDLQVSKLESEMGSIKSEIADLEELISPHKDIRPESLEETRQMIHRFEEQLALRQTKIHFYTTCKQKLNHLLDNHLLAQKLEEKQKTLQQLQEDQYEELADMERLKANLQYEMTYLKTIDRLSLRMLESQTLKEAEALKAELLTVSDELKNL